MSAADRDTRIIDLTVGQLAELLAGLGVGRPAVPERRVVYGIAGIAELFNCSITTANRIKRSGRIDAAVSQDGRTIVTDAEMALRLFARTATKRTDNKHDKHNSL